MISPHECNNPDTLLNTYENVGEPAERRTSASHRRGPVENRLRMMSAEFVFQDGVF
jgi:hypothetical protein